jgi:hypothetical protein
MISSDEHQRDPKLWSAGIGIACLLVINSTQAGPPFVTDDPEPPPPGSTNATSDFEFLELKNIGARRST